MIRCHAMPFGAAVRTPDETRFRLWAPSATDVALCLGERELAMTAVGAGWFEAVLHAPSGSRYLFRIDGGWRVPDPASRSNPEGVHGPSEVIDPAAFAWTDDGWRGRPWEEAVVYELHVGCFTPDGDFAGVARRLDYLAELGVTAIELMPVAAFAGRRNWGYDGVLVFAPAAAYGRPEDLKALVQAAHARSLMVLLDVVYNHFGPDGNYLGVYARSFFDERRSTPWGPAIAFDAADSRAVRDFYIHNALYWLDEFHVDGLRFDAVHAIHDDGEPHILTEIAAAVQDGPGRERSIHLVLENDGNAARFLRQSHGGYAAQWNDDFHHAVHRLLTREADGYYADYGPQPLRHLGRCLSEGFAYQGEPSPFRHHARRGEPSADLPPTSFVAFLQNHDQVGNRAYGERIAALAEPAPLRAAVALMLLAPSPPLLFMGEEFAAAQPFLYFCDFAAELGAAVSVGRRSEFAQRYAVAAESLPDPNSVESFSRSRLDWQSIERKPHRDWLAFYRGLLALRRREIVPRLAGMAGGAVAFHGKHALSARWVMGDGALLSLIANLGPDANEDIAAAPGALLYATPAGMPETAGAPPWSVAWYLRV